MAEYEEALALIEGHLDESDFQSQPEERVDRAEQALGVRFPPTYHRFLIELGAGGVGATQVYGVVDDDFEDSRPPGAIGLTLELRREGLIADDLVVIYALGEGSNYALATGQTGPDGEAPIVGFYPGLSTPSDKHEVMYPNFGSFFLETVKLDLEQL